MEMKQDTDIESEGQRAGRQGVESKLFSWTGKKRPLWEVAFGQIIESCNGSLERIEYCSQSLRTDMRLCRAKCSSLREDQDQRHKQ